MVSLSETTVHRYICNRFKTDHRFSNVRKVPADPRSPASLCVMALVDPNQIFSGSYPVSDARLEISFHLNSSDSYQHYWFNWIESDRELLVGWHQDDTHDDLGQVHFQLNHDGEVVERVSAQFIDAHPLQVVEARYEQLEDVLATITWNGDTPTGIDW